MGCIDAHKGTPVKEIRSYEERGCTDIFFALLYFAFWGATVWVILMAKADGGNPNKIIRGQDAYGHVCGEGPEASRPLVAWPFPPEYMYKMCVSDCSVTNMNRSSQVPGHAITWQMPSTQLAWYCIPSASIQGAELNIEFSGAFNADIGTRSFGDIWTAGPMICISAGIALVLSFIYTWFTNCASCLVWGCILLTIAGGSAAGYFLLTEAAAHAEDMKYDNRISAMRYLGWGFVVATSIFTLVVFFLRNQIRLAVQVVKEASRVMEHVPSLLLFPLLPIVLATGYVGLWLYGAVYIYSVGTDVEQSPLSSCTYKWMDGVTTGCTEESGNPQKMMVHLFDQDHYQNFLLAHCFGFLWNIQFLIYFGYAVIAGAVADWYFSPAESRRALMRTPLCASFCRTLRYHIGSIALGSLIIAVIQFVRGVITYLQRRAMSDRPNCLQRAIFAMVQCCMRCLECCIDKVNKNGFVWMSIWGDNFCVSSCSAFALIWRNLARVAAINMVGAYLITLGKFTVAALTTGLFAYLFVNTKAGDTLSSPVLPCLTIFLVSWSVAYLFMIVFETVIDATFLCFLVDHEHNAGGHMMASQSLQNLVGEHSKASEQEAALQHRMKGALRSGRVAPDDDYSPMN